MTNLAGIDFRGEYRVVDDRDYGTQIQMKGRRKNRE
jgi:hypothetical protein